MAQVTVYIKTAFTGDTTSSLDGINGSSILDGDVCYVFLPPTDNKMYVYILDADSGATEDVPNIIAPDHNAGNKRWILQSVEMASDSIAQSMATSVATADSTSTSEAVSRDASIVLAGGADSIAQSMATSVATKESTDTSEALSRDTSLSVVDSTNKSIALSADTSLGAQVSSVGTIDSTSTSEAVSRDTSISTNVSEADSKAQSIADAGVGTDSTARSMATSVATVETVTTSEAVSRDTSISTNLSTTESKANSLASGGGAGTDSTARSMATSVALVESTTTSEAVSRDTSLSVIDSANKSIALSADSSLSTVESTDKSIADSKSASLNTATIKGSGTQYKIPVFTAAGTEGDSQITDSAGTVTVSGTLTATKVYNSVYNDLVDYQKVADKIVYGRCYYDTPNGAKICDQRCQKSIIGIASDTWGYALGGEPDDINKVPIAIAGWVLAYVDENETYESGDALTNNEKGILVKMRSFEKSQYPERIVAIYKMKEKDDYWGEKQILVDGRHWVKVR